MYLEARSPNLAVRCLVFIQICPFVFTLWYTGGSRVRIGTHRPKQQLLKLYNQNLTQSTLEHLRSPVRMGAHRRSSPIRRQRTNIRHLFGQRYVAQSKDAKDTLFPVPITLAGGVVITIPYDLFTKPS